MEQLFQGYFFTFLLEFKEFSFYFSKATRSFLKLNWKLLTLLVFLLQSLGRLLFVGPVLYKWHSPNKLTLVERSTIMNFPRIY